MGLGTWACEWNGLLRRSEKKEETRVLMCYSGGVGSTRASRSVEWVKRDEVSDEQLKEENRSKIPEVRIDGTMRETDWAIEPGLQ